MEHNMTIRAINVFVDVEAYIVDVIVQAITRLGDYINKSEARYLIGQGLVQLDGVEIKSPDTVVEVGRKILNVNGRIVPLNIDFMPYQ
jgi:16S rRNA U516 pseudouridylate synthase RsuA-like enzyme